MEEAEAASLGRGRSVGRSVIPTREDEREEESAGRTELTHRTDGRIKRRTDADAGEGSIKELRR